MRSASMKRLGLELLFKERTAGVGTSFSSLYNDHFKYIRNLLFRFGIGSDLDDVVQDTFIKAWKALPKFENRSSIKTWLTRIAINTALEHIGKSKTFVIMTAETLQTTSATPYEAQDQVYKAMATLSFEHRVVLTLCIIEGYTLEETSEILKIPIGTVKSRLNRARQSMLSALQRMEVYP